MSLATQIGPDALVTVAYTLYDEDGDLIDRTEPEHALRYVHGYGQIFARLEQALEGMIQGQSRSVTLAPEDGYGDYDEGGVFEVERSDFPGDGPIAVDDEFIAESDDGEEVALRVVEVTPDAVIVDANHPLAGETLRFELEVLEVRPATDQELKDAEASLAEGEDGHHAHDGSCCEGEASPLVKLGPKPGAKKSGKKKGAKGGAEGGGLGNAAN